MTVGLALGALGVLVAVVAVLLQVLFCIALARFVTTGMAGLLRSRRGKDLAAFLVIPIFALYEFFTQVVPKVTAEGKLSASSFTGVDSWLRWLPPGQGYGSYALGSILGTLVCAAVAAVPVIVAAVLTSADPAGSGCRCSCYVPQRTASRWPGSACGSPPARPRGSCRSSVR